MAKTQKPKPEKPEDKTPSDTPVVEETTPALDADTPAIDDAASAPATEPSTPAPAVAEKAALTLDDIVSIANDESIKTGYITRTPELRLTSPQAETLARLAIGLGNISVQKAVSTILDVIAATKA